MSPVEDIDWQFVEIFWDELIEPLRILRVVDPPCGQPHLDLGVSRRLNLLEDLGLLGDVSIAIDPKQFGPFKFAWASIDVVREISSRALPVIEFDIGRKLGKPDLESDRFYHSIACDALAPFDLPRHVDWETHPSNGVVAN